MTKPADAKPLGLKIYRGLTALAGIAGMPWFYWHLKSRGFGESFWPRLGLSLPDIEAPGSSPRIWLHGVSVGEIAGVEPLVRELEKRLPPEKVFLSTGTETGQAVARRLYAPAHPVFYYPLDLPWAVRHYLDHLQPSLYVALETEIWPNFLQAARARGSKLAMVNGRLSEKSLRGYLKFGRQLKYIMKLFDVIAVGSSEDGQRFITLGADPDKVICTGSTKFERRPNLAAKAQAADFGQKLSHRGRSVFLAASTHPGEEEIVIAAYKKLLATSPALQLWLAPRHPERATIVGQLVREAGLDYQLWHRIKENEVDYGPGVLVIDTVGDLFALYCLADLIFVGGSLVPHGGQNLLEPASWGKMPLYGPFLDNFRAAHGLLHRAEAGMEIRDVASLVKTGEYCLTHPEEMQRRGQRGLMALQSHQGAAKRQAELLLKLLDKQERREKNLE